MMEQRNSLIPSVVRTWVSKTLGVGENSRAVTTSSSCTMENNNDGRIKTVNHMMTADRPKTLRMPDMTKDSSDCQAANSYCPDETGDQEGQNWEDAKTFDEEDNSPESQDESESDGAKDCLIKKEKENAGRTNQKEEREPREPRCTREKSKEAEDVVLTCDRARGGYYLEDAPYQGLIRSAYEQDDAGRGQTHMKNNSSNTNYSQSHLDYSTSSCNSSPGFLRHHYSYDHLKSSTAFSAPSSPASKYPQRMSEKKLLHRAEHSSPDLVNSPGGKGQGRLRKSLFKRFSGNNKDDLSGETRAGSMREKKNPKKVVESKKKARRTLSMGDDHLLCVPGEPNSIDAVKEEDEQPSDLPSENNSVNNRQMGGRKPRNIARDLKDKMRFLRRRHTDSSLRDTADKLDCEKSSLVQDSTESDVRKWSDCFENLLHDKTGLEAFRKFLQTEFSDENIEFWLACEEYKTLNTEVLTSRAQKIFEDYVTIQAPREVNLDSRTRLETTANVNHPDENTFDHAQKRIEALMEKDSYPRFLRSEIYQKLLKEFLKKSK
ncbi:uncharacterized protein LOC117303094 isoform X1 [Asterias rubens]|uniref:uncharacterized protein LOC117303094 isoform X1 n=1 Tax=Asterias rubens TaxID=7604 RepID=UPI0014557378|nr:uncharacterized protein LOC117303094 isoform X1 [Asterias rubens]